MAYTLKTDEILEALLNSGHPQGAAFRTQLEGLASAMAIALATSQGIECGAATFEGTGFAGTACTFRPAHDGQALPECMEGYDNAEEWSDGGPTGDASTCQHCGEERPLGPDSSVWTCGACNGLNCD